jgi:hypothetical protein
MNSLIIDQKVSLFLIVGIGFAVAISIILLKKHVGQWLIIYGEILAVSGLMLAVLFGKNFLDVLLLIDTEGFGRAYVSGCMLIFSGVLVLFCEAFDFMVNSLKPKK